MRLSVVYLVVLTAIGCVARSDSPADQSHDCGPLLDGRSFKGQPDECGLCGCGESTWCDWSVSFDEGLMHHSFSDVVTADPYVCADNEIRSADGTDLLATYDPALDVITINQRQYDACDGACDIEWINCAEACAGFCEGIDGSRFRTRSEQDCHCPSGATIRCHWLLEFDAGTFTWSHADGIESGSYICDSSGIDTGEGHVVDYNRYNDALLWNLVEYERCYGACEADSGVCPSPP